MLSWSLLIAVALGCVTLTPVGGPVKTNAHWHPKRFPLHLMLTNKLGGCRISKMVEAADRWNYELALAGAPVDAFSIQGASEVDQSRVGHLWVIPGTFPDSSVEPRTIGTCNLGYYKDTSRLWGALITMSDEHCLFRTSAHELGHALGLGHAPNACKDCIMNAQVPRHEGNLVDQGWIRRAELLYVIRQMRPSRRR
jgi:hypothetical protein